MSAGIHPDHAPLTAARLTADEVWCELDKASFAVVSYVTPSGEPRSSGVVYVAEGHRLFVVVAVDSWKARHIAATGQVAVTVPVRRGGVMSLVAPIPPATISFHATALVHPAGSLEGCSLPRRLASMVPPERRAMCRVLEIRPVGHFVTYGIDVTLLQMRDTTLARARVPVE
jgi:Pyridoxamine 5'-phosphate oxidase